MKTQKIVKLSAQSFSILSSVSLLSVSVMAFTNPQPVMDLAGVKLPNNDAFSSIRGFYALSQLITMLAEGTRGASGNNGP